MSAMKNAMRFFRQVGVMGYRSYGSGKQGTGTAAAAAQGPLADRKEALEGEYFYKKNLEDLKKMKEKKKPEDDKDQKQK